MAVERIKRTDTINIAKATLKKGHGEKRSMSPQNGHHWPLRGGKITAMENIEGHI